MSKDKIVQGAYFLLRIVAGWLFLQHGAQKLFGWPEAMPGGIHIEAMTQMWIGAIIEFGGGLLVFLGLFTRIAAFIMSGEMAVAYFQSHQPHGTWPIVNHGEPAVLFCFIFLFVCAYGGGEWSLDHVIFRKKSA